MERCDFWDFGCALIGAKATDLAILLDEEDVRDKRRRAGLMEAAVVGRFRAS